MGYTIESNGLITGPNEGQCAGYIFNFTGHGTYDPTGRVSIGNLSLTQAQVDTHNKVLGEAELAAATEQGRGLFYLSYETPQCTPDNPRWQQENRGEWYKKNYTVSNWSGLFKVRAFVTQSRVAGYNCSTRRHVYFTGPDGQRWYGIQQGEHTQVCRARRLKKQTA